MILTIKLNSPRSVQSRLVSSRPASLSVGATSYVEACNPDKERRGAFAEIRLGLIGELLYHSFPSLGSNARPSHPFTATRITGMQASLDFRNIGGDRCD